MSLINTLHVREPWEALKAKTVPRHRSSIWYYMGGLALFFFMIQLVTGVLLLIYYRPIPELAHESVKMIIEKVPFGELIRSIHSWSANALIAVVFIHMFSAFFMKSYRSPRTILWLSGVVLFVLILGFGFTGYLLPFDSTAYFATRIGTEIQRSFPIFGDLMVEILRGSKDVSGSTLIRLYALHIAILPMVALAFAAIHVAFTALIGSNLPPGVKVKSRILFIPDYIMGESILWLIGLAVLLTVAVLYPWGLGPAYDLAKPSEPPVGVHPEWYFMFLYQSLKYVPEWATVAFYALALIFWTIIPWLDRKPPNADEKALKSPLFTWIGILAIAGMAVLTTLAYISVGEERTKAATVEASLSPITGVHLVDTVSKTTAQILKQPADTNTWLWLTLAIIAFLSLVIFIVRSYLSKQNMNPTDNGQISP